MVPQTLENIQFAPGSDMAFECLHPQNLGHAVWPSGAAWRDKRVALSQPTHRGPSVRPSVGPAVRVRWKWRRKPLKRLESAMEMAWPPKPARPEILGRAIAPALKTKLAGRDHLGSRDAATRQILGGQPLEKIEPAPKLHALHAQARWPGHGRLRTGGCSEAWRFRRGRSTDGDLDQRRAVAPSH
jgi:hypothetical protein